MTIRMLLIMAITLYSSRVILKALGVVDFGIYNVVAGFVTMFAFMSTSLSSGIQRFYNFELGKNGLDGATKVYNAAFLIQVIFATIIVVAVEIVGIWYLNNKLVIPPERMYAAQWVFQFAIITLVFHILQVPYMAAVMAHEKMGFYALISVLNATLILLCVFCINKFLYDALIVYGIIQTLVAAFSFLSFYIYSKRKFSEIKLKKHYFEKTLLKEMLSFSGWNIFGTFGQMLKDQGINLILNSFFGPVLNAARGIATQINGALNSLVSNITIPVRPQLIQAYSQDNKNRAYNLTFSISKLTSYVMLMIAIPIILEIDYILEIWLGNTVPAYSNIFAVLIIIDSIVLNLNSSVSTLVHASGRMKWYQLSGGTISVISVLCAYISLVVYNHPAIVFIVLILLDIIRQILAVAIAVKIENSEFFTGTTYLKTIVSPIIGVTLLSLPLPLIIHHFMSSGIIRLIFTVLFAFLSVGIVTYLVGLSANERNLLKPIIAKFTKHI